MNCWMDAYFVRDPHFKFRNLIKLNSPDTGSHAFVLLAILEQKHPEKTSFIFRGKEPDFLLISLIEVKNFFADISI